MFGRNTQQFAHLTCPAIRKVYAAMITGGTSWLANGGVRSATEAFAQSLLLDMQMLVWTFTSTGAHRIVRTHQLVNQKRLAPTYQQQTTNSATSLVSACCSSVIVWLYTYTAALQICLTHNSHTRRPCKDRVDPVDPVLR